MRFAFFILSLTLVACGNDISEFERCNGAVTPAEVINRSQFTVETLELDDETVLTEPLAVDQTTVVQGFVNSAYVSFVRARPDGRDSLRITSESPICVLPGERLVLFDQSFRVEPSEQ